MNKILNSILYGFLWLFTLIPLRLLFLLSDVVFLVIYYIIPYRKNVVYKNLKNSFPGKSEKEIKHIIRSFYRYFIDFVFESIKSINLPLHVQKKRYAYKNPEVLNNLYDQGKNVVLVSGHYGNWEWGNLIAIVAKHKFLFAARKLKNNFSDKIIHDLRVKYGGEMIRMEETFRTIIRKNKEEEKFMIWLLSDQRPTQKADYWTDFLNQETAFFLGAGKMVKKLGMPLVFMDIQRVGRGRYEIVFELLLDSPTDLSEEEITKLHVDKLESIIKKKPENWLWSHKRWKHKRPLPKN